MLQKRLSEHRNELDPCNLAFPCALPHRRSTEDAGAIKIKRYVTFFRRPKSTSVCMVLSWASSSMMMAY